MTSGTALSTSTPAGARDPGPVPPWRTIRPPAGSGVCAVMPAAARAALLAQMA